MYIIPVGFTQEIRKGVETKLEKHSKHPILACFKQKMTRRQKVIQCKERFDHLR